MKKVWVSDNTNMVLESLDNIDKYHYLYDSYYEKEVDDDFHIHVYDSARVHDNAIVFGNAEVCDNAIVTGNARVGSNAEVCGDTLVGGNSLVLGYARVVDNAIVTKDAINVIGLPLNVTLTDNHIRIGCKQFTLDHAKRLAERNIDIDDDEYNKMIKHKDLLLALINEREENE